MMLISSQFSAHMTQTLPLIPISLRVFAELRIPGKRGLRNVFENQQQKWGGRGFPQHFDLQIDRMLLLLLLLLLEWWWWWNGGKMEQLHHHVKNECLLSSLSLSRTMIWSRKQAGRQQAERNHESMSHGFHPAMESIIHPRRKVGVPPWSLG